MMGILQIAAFLLIAAGIIFGAHWFVWFSAVRFFGIVSALETYALAGLLFFLAAGFFVSSALVRFADAPATRGAYFVSASWLGLMLYLLAACALAWIAIGAGRSSGFAVPQRVVGGALMLAALAVATHGLWNAANPRVTRVTARIPGLPASWKGKTIVQISDVHLGSVHRQACARDIVALANAEHPALVAITGDLFDGTDGAPDGLAEPLDGLRSEHGTFFITGNHETYMDQNVLAAALAARNFRTLKNEVVDVDGLKLIGVDFAGRGEFGGPAAELDKLKPQYEGKPNVLLYHAPSGVAETKARGVNLQLSGHTHDGQLWPLRYVAMLAHKGYSYGLFEEGDYSLYVTNGVGTWGPPMRVGRPPEIVAITLE